MNDSERWQSERASCTCPVLLHTDVLDPRPPGVRPESRALAAVHLPPTDLSHRTHELPSATQLLRVINDAPWCADALDALAKLGRTATRGERADVQSAVPGAAYRLWTPNEFLEQTAAQLRPARAVDLGCGSGRDAVFLAACGWYVSAIDWLPDALDRARQLERSAAPALPHPVSWRCADLENPETALEEAELVTMFRFLDRPLLRRVAEQLSPATTLLVETFTAVHRARHGRPNREQFVLAAGELPSLVPGLQVVTHEEAWRSDGSHTARLRAVARDIRNSARTV